jgi:hypothetical protein
MKTLRPLLSFIAATFASLLLYVGVFSVVHRPLTLGDIPRQLELKLRHGATLPSPRLVIFAGSNGRYSHRCEPMAAPLGLPCVNMSIAVGVGLDFMLEQLAQMLRPGDLVYMPLEYGQYTVDQEEMEAGAHNAVLVHDLPAQLRALPWPAIVRAYGSFDLSFLVHGLIEMGLARTGFQRRTSLDTLTPQGDESRHTAAKALAYRSAVAAAKPTPLAITPTPHVQAVLGRFLQAQQQRGVRVVGGLPTVPLGAPVPAATVAQLQGLFVAHGQQFLVLPGRSQYELTCFFDSVSHLHEGCQIEHSRRVGAALAEMR